MTYHCIVADPPWNEAGGGKVKRGADRHYGLLRLTDIARTMLNAPVWRPANHCHLWMWVTTNHLTQGLSLMEQLGFRYVRNAVWVKARTMDNRPCDWWTLQPFGLGQYLRGQHELLLFGVKGNLPAKTRDQGDVILAPKGRHSEKPQAAYDLIQRVSPGPYLEMFARQPRSGFKVWGDEVQP